MWAALRRSPGYSPRSWLPPVLHRLVRCSFAEAFAGNYPDLRSHAPVLGGRFGLRLHDRRARSQSPVGHASRTALSDSGLVPAAGRSWQQLPAPDRLTTLHVLQVLFGVFEMGKELFLVLKGPRVHAAPASAQLNRMAQVKHLVKHEIFDRVTGHGRAVKDTADHNGVVGRIVVAQALPRAILAPGH